MDGIPTVGGGSFPLGRVGGGPRLCTSTPQLPRAVSQLSHAPGATAREGRQAWPRLRGRERPLATGGTGLSRIARQSSRARSCPRASASHLPGPSQSPSTRGWDLRTRSDAGLWAPRRLH